jgi:hypothetical protein
MISEMNMCGGDLGRERRLRERKGEEEEEMVEAQQKSRRATE